MGTTHLGAPTARGAPWWVVVSTWAPSLTSRKKNLHCSLSRVLAPRISISLLEAPFPKLFWGIVAWYVTPPFVQLVFVLMVYSLNNYLLLVLL